MDAAGSVTRDDARLADLGYEPQLNRVLGFFSNGDAVVGAVGGHVHDSLEATGAERAPAT